MKIFVGLSGGVDSSIAAQLLKDQGHEVTGCFIRVWTPDWLPCTQEDDRLDAMRTAAHLNIPFREIDAETTYKQKVVDYMVSEYEAGRTPNPDIMCNTFVKFGVFYKEALDQGAEAIATGHYVRKVKRKEQKEKSNNIVRNQQSTIYELHTGIDVNKDQSYFLWNVSPEALALSHFPLGELTKPEVRQLAHDFGLPTADKKDSQGLCMMGGVDLRQFLEHFITLTPGLVKNEQGQVIGHHESAVPLTIGQRHGFTITKKNPNDPPHYIVSKDITTNTIVVSPEPRADNPRQINLSKTNWITQEPEPEKTYQARLRYRGPLFPVQLEIENDQALVKTETTPDLIPIGQSLVVYDGEVLIGGGIIC